MRRPDPSEYFEYYRMYIDLVPEGDVLAMLSEQVKETTGLLEDVPPELADYRYAEGKWSVKEVVAHLIDVERTFGFRALWFARRNPEELPPFDQEVFGRFCGADQRSLDSLLEEFVAVRKSSELLYRSFDEEMLSRTGTASGYQFTVRTFPYLTAGHELHHRRILRDRYLSRQSRRSK